MTTRWRVRGSHWKADGTPKVEYTEEEAHIEATLLEEKGDERYEDMGIFPVAYKCSACDWWHVGNMAR